MTAPIIFNLQVAQEALARSDEGANPLPGDAFLIEAYEGFCQQEWDRYWQPIEDAEYKARLAEWMSDKCPDCEEDGTGLMCDEHSDEPEVAA